jgi:hypothetical protein
VDVASALSALAGKRPVFHSERDFQHALAWQIQLASPQAQIRLETRPRRGIHLDLLVRLDGRRTAIELKYLVARLHATVGGVLFDLPHPSANDISRHDVVKDITRIEAVLADGHADSGCVLVLSNDRSYWRSASRADTIDEAFRLHEGHVLHGTMGWAARAGKGTTRPPGHPAAADRPLHLPVARLLPGHSHRRPDSALPLAADYLHRGPGQLTPCTGSRHRAARQTGAPAGRAASAFDGPAPDR